jgi:TolA-binding protein
MRQSEESERKEKESLQQALDALVAEYDRLVAEKDQSTTDQSAIESKLNTAMAELQTALDKEAEIQKQWNKDRSHMESVETERNSLQLNNSELETKNISLEQQLAQAQDEVVKLTGWVEQLQIDLREAITLAAESNKKLNEFVTKSVEVIELPAVEQTVIEQDNKQTDNATVLDFDPNLGYEQRYFHKATADNDTVPESGKADFGTKFPTNPARGDMYLRVDFLPPVLYKWNGTKWIEIDRKMTDRLAYNQAYIEHLVAKIRSGEYDIDDLNDVERAEVAAYLNGNGTIQ